LRERVEETCELARNELAKVQARSQRYNNRRAQDMKLHTGDSVQLLLPTDYRAQRINLSLARSVQSSQ